MTERERIERANRARMAMEEFFAPAFAVVEREYGERMIEVAASPDPRAPDIIARLANGIKVARQVRAQIDAIVADGDVARRDVDRDAIIAEMTPAKRRLLNIGQV
jgi:hypothetical protein